MSIIKLNIIQAYVTPNTLKRKVGGHDNQKFVEQKNKVTDKNAKNNIIMGWEQRKVFTYGTQLFKEQETRYRYYT